MLPAYPNFDAMQAERMEQDLIVGNDYQFAVPKTSLLKFFGKKNRFFTLKQPAFGTMTAIDRELMGIELDPATFQDLSTEDRNRLMAKNGLQLCRVVAISVLQSKWKIDLFLPVLSRYFLWRINPQKMLHIVRLVVVMTDMENFIDSIGLLKARKRTTQPAPIEEGPQDTTPLTAA